MVIYYRIFYKIIERIMGEKGHQQTNRLLKEIMLKNPSIKWREVSEMMKSQYGIELTLNQCYSRWKAIQNNQKPKTKPLNFSAEQIDTLLDLLEKYGNNWAQIDKNFPTKRLSIIKTFTKSLIVKSITSLYRIISNKNPTTIQISEESAKKIQTFLMGEKTGLEQSVIKLRNRIINFIRFMYSDSRNRTNIHHDELHQTYELLLIIKQYTKTANNIQEQIDPSISESQERKEVKMIKSSKKAKLSSKIMENQDCYQQNEVPLRTFGKKQLSNLGQQRGKQLQLYNDQEDQIKDKKNSQILDLCESYCKHNGNYAKMMCRDNRFNQKKIENQIINLMTSGLQILQNLIVQRNIGYGDKLEKCSKILIQNLMRSKSNVSLEIRIKLLNLNYSKVISNHEIMNIIEMSSLHISQFSEIPTLKQPNNLRNIIRGKIKEAVEENKLSLL